VAFSRRGILIAFEGPEGAGKTNQMAALGRHLRDLGETVVETREPGGTPLGNAVRGVLLDRADLEIDGIAELFLLAAARIQHVRDVIAPALRRGDVVLCDRYIDSTFAYQGGGRGLPDGTLAAVQEIATDGVLPDVRVLLDVPVEIGLARRFGDSDAVNRLDRLDMAFHNRVRMTYLERARQSPDDWIVIDAVPSVDEVGVHVQSKVTTWIDARRRRENSHPEG
jgi:dTMP kinase